MASQIRNFISIVTSTIYNYFRNKSSVSRVDILYFWLVLVIWLTLELRYKITPFLTAFHINTWVNNSIEEIRKSTSTIFGERFGLYSKLLPYLKFSFKIWTNFFANLFHKVYSLPSFQNHWRQLPMSLFLNTENLVLYSIFIFLFTQNV